MEEYGRDEWWRIVAAGGRVKQNTSWRGKVNVTLKTADEKDRSDTEGR